MEITRRWGLIEAGIRDPNTARIPDRGNDRAIISPGIQHIKQRSHIKRLARSVGAREISTFSDSQLVTSQFHGKYGAENKRMEAYLTVLKEIAQQFDKFELTRIP